MRFEEALKRITEERIEVTDGHYTLFGSDNKLYYTYEGHTKTHAIEHDHRPNILAISWWEKNWEVVKEEVAIPDDWTMEGKVQYIDGRLTVEDFKTFIRAIKKDVDNITLNLDEAKEEDWKIKVNDRINKRKGKL